MAQSVARAVVASTGVITPRPPDPKNDWDHFMNDLTDFTVQGNTGYLLQNFLYSPYPGVVNSNPNDFHYLALVMNNGAGQAANVQVFDSIPWVLVSHIDFTQAGQPPARLAVYRRPEKVLGNTPLVLRVIGPPLPAPPINATAMMVSISTTFSQNARLITSYLENATPLVEDLDARREVTPAAQAGDDVTTETAVGVFLSFVVSPYSERILGTLQDGDDGVVFSFRTDPTAGRWGLSGSWQQNVEYQGGDVPRNVGQLVRTEPPSVPNASPAAVIAILLTPSQD